MYKSNDNLVQKEQANEAILHTLWLNLNRECNLRCEWCYAKMTGYVKDDMSLETVRKHVNLAAELGADSVVIIGGEPTLHDHFFEIVRIIHEKGLRPCLVTNGMKFSDKEFLKQAIEAGLSSITLSFKASNREMFLREMGKDQFDEQVQAVKNVVQSGIRYTLSVTVCESLMENFNEMIQAVKSTGADNMLLDTGKPVVLNGRSTSDGMRKPKEVAKFIMEMYPKLQESGLKFLFKLALPFCLFPKDFIEELLRDGRMMTGCQMMKEGGLIIDPKGRILPCNHLCEQSLGKMGEDFSTAAEFQLFMKEGGIAKFHQYINTCPDKRCVGCSYWEICGSGCKLYWLHYGADSMLGDFSNPKLLKNDEIVV